MPLIAQRYSRVCKHTYTVLLPPPSLYGSKVPRHVMAYCDVHEQLVSGNLHYYFFECLVNFDFIVPVFV